MRAPIVVDRTSTVPLHRQIYDEWRRAILAGRFGARGRLPSTRELAASLAVSRATVTAAYDQLTAEGYIESARGRGTFVCRDLPDEPVRPPRPGRRSSSEGAAARATRVSPPVTVSRYAARLDPVPRRSAPAAGVINLTRHGPDLDFFPFRVWRRLILRHLRKVTPALFEYAAHGAGHEPLRQEIARYVGRSRAVACTPDQVIVVNGSQQALDLCARVLVEPGDDIAVENPGYQGARQLFAAHGARLRPVRVASDGIVVAELPANARAVYVTPSHHFPTGVSMSLTRRLELIEWARAHGAALIEDDYDSEYRFSGPPLPALQGLAEAVPVIYVGTFSNVMFPGLRIGFIVPPRDLVEPFARAKWHTDRHTTFLEQAALADFLRDGHLERHVRRMRRLYKRRREALIDALTRHFGDRVSIPGEAAGMYLVARFAPGAIRGGPASRGVHLATTQPYYMTGAPPNEYLIRFAEIDERTIREGVRRLTAP